MPQNAFFLWTRDLFVSQKMTQRHFFHTLHPLSTVVFATATVLAFVLLRDSRFNFHCYTAWGNAYWEIGPEVRCDLSRHLARKITKRIHSSKPASLNRPILQTQINTTIPRTNIISTIKQLISAVSQFLRTCRNIRIKLLSWVYMYTTLTFLGKRVIQTNQSKFDKRLFSDIHFFAGYVWNKEEKYMILYCETWSSRGTLQRRIC